MEEKDVDAEGVLVLDPRDNVGVATRDLPGIPRGHKVALCEIGSGEHIYKYGHVIGVASTPVQRGEHIHSHNVAYVEEDGDYAFATEPGGLPDADAFASRTFMGYPRADGRVGTRNYIGVLASVNCSASTAKMIVEASKGLVDDYAGVDGIVALTHTSGCGMIPNSPGGSTLQRTLHGYASHPNFGGLLLLGLGCEMLQVSRILDTAPIPSDTEVRTLKIQDEGGIRRTVEAGVAAIAAMLPVLDARVREPMPISSLVLGLNCGGSDSYSGLTANPALGYASDLLVACGGTSVLAETPEVFGAESLLTRRAVSEGVGRKLLDRVSWWREYVRQGNGSLDNNPSPGNKAGGLTTILEKSLGAVAKSGHAPLHDVLLYGQRVPQHAGLVLMDTPGYDPVSLTGLIAGGANVIVFTTGRGSVIGARPTPVIKVASSSELFEKMRDDMDMNAGPIISATATTESIGDEILEAIIQVASGAQTVSEELNLGQEEFVPWNFGAVT